MLLRGREERGLTEDDLWSLPAFERPLLEVSTRATLGIMETKGTENFTEGIVSGD